MVHKAIPTRCEFVGRDQGGVEVFRRTFRSVGGGFLTEDGVKQVLSRRYTPYPYVSGVELVAQAERLGCISAVAAANESALLPANEVMLRLLQIASTMNDCIERGLRTDQTTLPGGLHVQRRAPSLWQSQVMHGDSALAALEWVSLWAIAVNEENAAGGRIVTAPTNGAAGVVPAVLRYAQVYEHANEKEICRFLLAGRGRRSDQAECLDFRRRGGLPR